MCLQEKNGSAVCSPVEILVPPQKRGQVMSDRFGFGCIFIGSMSYEEMRCVTINVDAQNTGWDSALNWLIRSGYVRMP